MSEQFDFKKEWEKTKEQLIKISQEASKIAKKSEEEIVKFSKKGKLHIDSTAITLRKEQLYYFIGKEYVQAKAPEQPNAKIKGFLAELEKIDAEQKVLKVKMKNVESKPVKSTQPVKQEKKKAVKKTAKKKQTKKSE